MSCIILGSRHDIGPIIIAGGPFIHAVLRNNVLHTGIVGDRRALQDIRVLPVGILLPVSSRPLTKMPVACSIWSRPPGSVPFPGHDIVRRSA